MRVVTIVILALTLTGCATKVVAPPRADDAAPVYLTNYGRHSSILLPAREGHFIEYAFGDWNWFAVNRNTSGDAVAALFFSSGSSLGRRQLKLGDDLDAIAVATGAKTVSRFDASRARIDTLIERLDRQYDRRIDTITYNALSQLWFVESGIPYSVLHNCNHLTADWLRRLGCSIDGPVMLSNFKVVSPRPRAADNVPQPRASSPVLPFAGSNRTSSLPEV